MSQKKTARETQHYVPQMMLRRFANKGKGKVVQIHVFDKKDIRTFKTGTNNILAENNFYDIFEYSMEPALSKLETLIGPIFEKIITEKTLSCLSEEDKLWLSAFVMAQHLRTKNFRNRQQEMGQAILDKFQSVPGATEVIMEEFVHTDEDAKRISLEFISEELVSMSEYIVNKDWHLMETTEGNPFWIGDNPVTMHNNNDFRPYANIGFQVRGIQIYLPLSPTLTIAFWCPSIRLEMEEFLKRFEPIKSKLSAMNVMAKPIKIDVNTKDLEEKAQRSQSLLEAMRSGEPQMINEDNVLFHNSMQYRHAERYIISNSPDMSFAEQMSREKPEWQEGPRLQIN
jgi:hypothetical protein